MNNPIYENPSDGFGIYSEYPEVSYVRYTEGMPKNYRFDSQKGRFNIDGVTDIGTELTFTPLGFRIFKGDPFGQGAVKLWAELFFIDEMYCLSCITFGGTSAQEILALQGRLYYNSQELTDVEISVSSVPKSSDKGRWHLATFKTKPAKPAVVEFNRLVMGDTKIYRLSTIQQGQETRVCFYVDIPEEFQPQHILN